MHAHVLCARNDLAAKVVGLHWQQVLYTLVLTCSAFCLTVVQDHSSILPWNIVKLPSDVQDVVIAVRATPLGSD